MTNITTAQRKRTKGQTIPQPKEKGQRTNNTTAQRKRTKGHTIQKPKEKGQKDKQYNSPKEKSTKGQTATYKTCT
jgi:hypothetical protein